LPWLHRAVESYRLPRDVVPLSARGLDRITPVFRDAEELPAASDLTQGIQDALRWSDALIVVCSPDSVRSPWVEKEIRFFVSLGRADKVLGVIASGTPYAADPRRECLPPALRQSCQEVLAPDASRKGGPRRAALLKIIAGLHGLMVGHLIERDALRRRVQRLQATTLATIVLAVASALMVAWRGESGRAALEVQRRLLAQARTAFEDGHPEQGITALAAAWRGLSRTERAQYEAVVDAWLPALPDIRPALAGLKRNSLFKSSDRLYFFDGHAVVRLPYSTNVLAGVDARSRAVYAISPSGQVTEWTPGIGSQKVLVEGGDQWSSVIWKKAAVLRGGTVLFSGDFDADQLSEQWPALLVVRPKTRRWYFIMLETDHFYRQRYPGLFLSHDCRTLAWVASSKSSGGHFTLADPEENPAIYSMRLDDQASSPERVSRPPSDDSYANVRVQHGDDFLSSFAGRCSDSPVTSVRDEKKELLPDLTLPLRSAARAGDPTIDDTSTQVRNGRRAQRAAFLALGDNIQRSQFDLVGGTAGTVDKKIVADGFPGGNISFMFSDRLDVIEYCAAHQTLFGYDRWVDETICVAGRNRAKPQCIKMHFHRMEGLPRIYPAMVYVPGGRVPDDPLFVLVKLPDLKPIAFRDARLTGEVGIGGAASALSPSTRHFALLSHGRILLFNLDPELKATLGARFDVPALVGQAETEVDGSPAFVGEKSIAIARRDGLVVLMDLSTRTEAWRFRIPNTGARVNAPSRVELISSKDGSVLAVRGNDFAVGLDSRSGLPLRPPVETLITGDYLRREEPYTNACEDAYFVGHCFALPAATTASANPSLFSQECVGRQPLRRCFSRHEVTQILDRARLPPGSWLRKASNGSMVAAVGPEDSGILLDPVRRETAAERESQLYSVRCRTGWTIDGTRLTRVDALAAADADGHAVAIGAIGERCRS
jgi:MTH538 TIR-like domain (DUF1863)